MKKILSFLNSRHPLLLFLLAAFAVIGNRFPLPLMLGVDILFGSIFSLFTLLRFGLSAGLAVTAVSGGITIFLWGHPYALIILILETIFAGIAVRKFRKAELTTVIIIYWITLGMPLALLAYKLFIGMSLQATLVIMLKQSLNGILNASIASFILFSMKKHHPGQNSIGSEKDSYSLRMHLTQPIFVCTILTVFILLSIFSKAKFNNLEQRAVRNLSHRADMVKNTLSVWQKDHLQKMKYLQKVFSSSYRLASPSMPAAIGMIRKLDPGLLSLCILKPDGSRMFCSHSREENRHHTRDIHKKWVMQIKSLSPGKALFTTIPPDKNYKGQPAVLLGKALKKNGKLRGCITGTLKLDTLSRILVGKLPGEILTFLDNSGRIIFSSDKKRISGQQFSRSGNLLVHRISQRIFRISKKSISNPMQRWRKSRYVTEILNADLRWKVIDSISAEPYQIRLYFFYNIFFSISAALITLSVIIGDLMARKATRPLTILNKLSSQIPATIEKTGSIEWPESAISEVQSLTMSFKKVENILKMRFGEHIQMEKALRDAKEQAEQSSNFKSEFLANMSHEIRTPITGIMGLTEMMLSGSDETRTHENIQSVYNSAEILLTLINDILDLSKIEAGKLEIVAELFQPGALLHTIVTPFLSKAEEKGIDFQIETAENLPNCLKGDSVRVRQILNNLLSNAFKFTEEGYVRLSTEVRKDAPPKKVRLQFRIEDSGIGIKPEELDRIFQEFTQADNSIAKKFGGTGLGLTITRRLVSMMSGSLNVKSEPGRGTKFTVVLDFDTAAAGECSMKENRIHNPEKYFGMQVILAEDNPVNRVFLGNFLAMAGFQTTCADNGLKVLDLLRNSNNHYDIILMDIQMPELDGISTTEIIRSGKEKNIDPGIPIIALTAYAMKGDREKILKAGLDDYIMKPVSKDVLLNTIGKTLEAKNNKSSDNGLKGEPPKKSEPSFRPETIFSEYSDNPDAADMVRELYTVYLEHSETLRKDLAESLEKRNMEGARKAAHKLVNSTGVIQARHALTLCRSIEEKIRTNTMNGIKDDITKLNTELNGIKREIKNYLNRL